MARTYRTEAVVLRSFRLGEADRVLHVYTADRGRVGAVAKGVRRTTSRFGARVEPFCHVDVQLYTGRTLDVITQVQTVDAFGLHIVDDYQRYTAACAVLETVDRLAAEEGEPVLRLYLLAVGALRALAVLQADRSVVAPRVPTVAEAGLPVALDTGWFGLLAPAGTPPDVLDRLQRAVAATLADPAYRRRLADQGFDPSGGGPTAFATQLASDVARFPGVLRRIGARVD